MALLNTVTTNLSLGGAATTIAIGAAASDTTWTGQSFTLTGANSTDNTVLAVTNTSNAAAASHSYVDVSVGGTTSTGDPQLRLTIPGGTSWYAGVDNSDSDVFEIGTGTAVGTATYIRITSNAVNFDTTAELHVVKSNSGGTQLIVAQNNSNTASSDAAFRAMAGGTSSGDPYVNFSIGGAGTEFCVGIDNSDSDAFVISASSVLGTTNCIRCATNQVITIPNLAGAGSRTVVADANGVLSAP